MSQDCRKIIATNVKEYREKLGFTREKLSLLIDRDPSYISKLERSEVNVSIDTLEILANELSIGVIDLFKRK